MTSAFLGPLCALLSSVTWAIGSARYSLLSRSHSAFAVNFARGLFALPLFAAMAFVETGSWSGGLSAFAALRAPHLGWFALSMVASYGLGDVLFLSSTRILGIPTALAIASSYPLWTAGAARFFRGEQLAPLQGLGLALAVLGVILVILNSPGLRGTEGALKAPALLRKGLALAFLTSIMWALNSFSVSQGGRELSVPVSNTVRMAFALVLSAGFGRIFMPEAPVLLPRKVMISSLSIFALEAFGGSYFYMYGLTHSPLAVGATLSSLAPVMAVPVSLVLGLEKFSIYRTLAICIVAVGVSFLLGGA